MSKEYFDDNFFVIDTNNLKDTKGRFYGYVIDEDRIIINSDECNYHLPLDSYGCYVHVVTTSESIEIYQDYFGSYGIYLYEENDYFALSNSFLYLVNYLKVRKQITFDDEYAKAFLAAPQAALTYQDTMVKEIKMLPRNSYIKIRKKHKKLQVCFYEQKEAYIDINTEDAIKIIDGWHKKWNTIFRTILKENLDLSFGISGGKDSRVSFACCVKPKLKLEEINFFSATDTLVMHSDDYRIAKQIAEQYTFTLNAGTQPKRFKMDPLDNLNASLLIKCGFHRELMPSHFWHEKPVFYITGSGGDLRDLWNEPAEDFIERMCSYTIYNSVNCRKPLKNMMNKTKEMVDSCICRDGQKLTANDYFYKQARQRNHNGKANAESFMSNMIILSPLMDPVLYKLNQNIGRKNDNDLLYAVIYQRYLPEISGLEFDSGRIVKKETMDVADEINCVYPLKDEMDSKPDTIKMFYNRIAPMRTNDKKTAHDYLKKTFYSEAVKTFVNRIFGEELYKRADIYYRTKDYHPYFAAAGLVESYIIYKATRESCTINNFSSSVGWIDEEKEVFVPRNYSNNGFMKECLDYLQAGRIDIKNCGTYENEIIFTGSSDEKIYVSTPDWFSNNQGKGKVFQSCKGEAVINFQTIGKGDLLIRLMGPWIKDDNQPLSVKIDFMKFIVRDMDTNKILISVLQPVTVDSIHFQTFKIPCVDKQRFVLEAEWLPYIYGESELVNLLDKMYYRGINDYKFWKMGENNS